jgi:hypothetical protein
MCPLMMQVDRGLKQHPHGAYPSGIPDSINHPLQITQVMRQTELMRLGGRFHLRSDCLAAPDLNRLRLPQNLGNNRKAACVRS